MNCWRWAIGLRVLALNKARRAYVARHIDLKLVPDSLIETWRRIIK
jgi:hypothetical protein